MRSNTEEINGGPRAAEHGETTVHAGVTRFSPNKSEAREILAAQQLRSDAPQRSPIHIAQLSIDWQIVTPERDGEPLQRQRDYFAELCRQRPGSTMTIVILVRNDSPLAQTASSNESAEARAARISKESSPPGFDIRVARCSALSAPWVAFRELTKLHRQHPISVITAQRVFDEGFGALIASRMIGVPNVGQIHFDLFSEGAQQEMVRGNPLRWLRSQLAIRWAIPRFSAIRVDGCRVGEELKRRGLIKRYTQLPVPSPLVRERPETGTSAASRKRNQVLFVGRLAVQKRLDRWLTVAQLVSQSCPDSEFVIIGDGPERAALESQMRALGLASRVVFTGNIPNAEVEQRIAQTGVFLLTSDYEGLARVVLEAMSMGIPVVSTKIGGSEDIIESGKTGVLAETPEALAAAVVELLRNPAQADQIGAAGKEAAISRFGYTTLVKKWVSLLVDTALERSEEIRTPRTRTWDRWYYFTRSPLTFTRAAQYEAVSTVDFGGGRVLDLGGGIRPKYRSLLKGVAAYESVNIFSGAEPTIVHDLNQPLPIADAQYEGVLSLNTYEHLLSDELAFKEAVRVLKPGGKLCIAVPYLYQVHGSPSDYSRHTAFWWLAHCRAAGLEEIQIEPLVWSRLVSLISIGGNSLPWRILRAVAMLRGVLVDLLLGSRQEHRAANRSSEIDANYPNAYLIVAKKKQ